MSIGELRRVLRDCGILGEVSGEPTSTELADALWLAAMRRTSRPAPSAAGGTLGEFPHADIPDDPGRESGSDRSESESVSPTAATGEPQADSHIHARLPASSGASSGVLVSAAARPQLPEPLALARAMRPLRRLVPSAGRSIIDEEATANLCAEQRIWLPALTPASEPAFDLALVIDDSESMALWSEKVREFRSLCERLGAFQDVRLWYLAASRDGASDRPVLRGVSRASGIHDARELLDPSGRRLILVVTDGVHPWWRLSGPLRPLLARWALASPLAIVQPFPQRLWGRSPLRPVIEEFRPGWPGSGPTINRPAYGQVSGGSVAVPILELAPAAMRRWAGVVSGNAGTIPLPAAVLPRESTAGEEPSGTVRAGNGESTAQPDPLRLVRDFRASVSPAAYQLAGYLSAAPLTLPVMRLVQESMMPETGPAELAEVFLSGLLRRSTEAGSKADAQNVSYVFVAGVRGVLQSALTRDEALSVLDRVGSYLVKRRQSGRSFPVILDSQSGEAVTVTAAEHFPASFGRISRMLLDRIGGPYAEAIRGQATPNTAVREDQEAALEEASDARQASKHQEPPVSQLSPLLAFHLERCGYWGVPAASVARGEFSEEDLRRVDDLVSGPANRRVFGRDRPRERAELNLSAARIMQDLGITDDGFRKRLRYFAAAMGDACALEERVTADVIRAYYTEAVGVKSDWDDVVDVKLRQLVMSFVLSNVQLLERGMIPSLEKALALAMARKPLAAQVLAVLLALPVQGEVPARLIRRIWADRVTRELFQQALTTRLDRKLPVGNQKGFVEAWLAAAEQDRNRREIYGHINQLTEAGHALGALDRHSAELTRVSQGVQDLESVTDLARLASCLQVVADLQQYTMQHVYLERERLFASVRTSIRTLVAEFEDAPTVLSVGTLRPYLRALDKQLGEDFEQYAAIADPDRLKVELLADRYSADHQVVTVQLQVYNRVDASPISNVELEVVPGDDYEAARNIVPVAESIGAGESRTCEISMAINGHAIEQELITLQYRVHFTLRSRQRVTAPVEAISVRLLSDEEWVEIQNPYSAGLPVEDPYMFMGRDQFIAEITERMGRSGGCVIIYGQKRAGKSSILYHLKESLTLPHVTVRFSVAEFTGMSISGGEFLCVIGREVYRALSNLVEDLGLSTSPMPEINIDQIRLAPQSEFSAYLLRLQEWRKAIPELREIHLVLLIDEFSLLYQEIRQGALSPDFMKTWKALLERRLFSCVLAGDEMMPRFIREFPNELGIAVQKRVSYLDPEYARHLIEDPIRLQDGQSRYRGNSVDRILELTGCSPYYIQMFCYELVRYLNREEVRARVVGPADVDTVAKMLVAAMDIWMFDNLLAPGDREDTEISEALIIDVLRATHRESGAFMYHTLHPNSHPEADRVIQDLVRREVLKRISGDRYRIQVGLFSEWLQHQWANLGSA